MGTGVDSNVALPTRLACLTNLPLFTPRFYTVTRCPPSPGTQNTTSPSQPDPASLTPIGQDAPRAWMGQEGASLVPPRGWEIRTAMRLMLRDTKNWKLVSGMGGSQPAAPLPGIIGCHHPSMRREDSPESTLLFCQLRIVMSVRFSFPSGVRVSIYPSLGRNAKGHISMLMEAGPWFRPSKDRVYLNRIPNFRDRNAFQK